MEIITRMRYFSLIQPSALCKIKNKCGVIASIKE